MRFPENYYLKSMQSTETLRAEYDLGWGHLLSEVSIAIENP